jgi:hypothetical protein
VYVLDRRLQAGKHLPKWDDKACIGLFLSWSPRHSCKVALILNLITGHVSPQFHVEFDDMFETMRPSAGNSPPKSTWQQKAGILDTEKDPKGRNNQLSKPIIKLQLRLRGMQADRNTIRTINMLMMRVRLISHSSRARRQSCQAWKIMMSWTQDRSTPVCRNDTQEWDGCSIQ